MFIFSFFWLKVLLGMLLLSIMPLWMTVFSWLWFLCQRQSWECDKSFSLSYCQKLNYHLQVVSPACQSRRKNSLKPEQQRAWEILKAKLMYIWKTREPGGWGGHDEQLERNPVKIILHLVYIYNIVLFVRLQWGDPSSFSFVFFCYWMAISYW